MNVPLVNNIGIPGHMKKTTITDHSVGSTVLRGIRTVNERHKKS